jgi:hypothetical protein
MERGRPRPQIRASIEAKSVVFEGAAGRPFVAVGFVGRKQGMKSCLSARGRARTGSAPRIARTRAFADVMLDLTRSGAICHDSARLVGNAGSRSTIHPPSTPKRSGRRAILPFWLRFIIFKGRTYSDLLGLWSAVASSWRDKWGTMSKFEV